MKNKIFILILGFLLICVNLYAADGDFIIEGNIGIGTSSPGVTLDVRGDAVFNEDGFDNDFRIEGVTDANLFFIDAGNNRVGIGTNAPSQLLHIKGTGAAEMFFESTTSPSWPKIRFANPNDEWTMRIMGITGTFQIQNQNTENVPLTLKRGTFNNDDAKVGINKISPSYNLDVVGNASFTRNVLLNGNNVKLQFGAGQNAEIYYDISDMVIDPKVVGSGALHVKGDINADGIITSINQDLAEWVKTSENLTTGTVVMIDPEQVNQVLPSDKPYNTLVAGVVSDTPGVLLGKASKDKAKIAHTGRLKVKVDTNYGKIIIGDLLVTSPRKGYAMKADSNRLKPGMLLGKALEPLNEGQQGEILVLLTLQ